MSDRGRHFNSLSLDSHMWTKAAIALTSDQLVVADANKLIPATPAKEESACGPRSTLQYRVEQQLARERGRSAHGGADHVLGDTDWTGDAKDGTEAALALLIANLGQVL